VISVVPELRLVTIPVEGSIVAAVVLLLVHVPPEGELESVVVYPVHTPNEPVIAPGRALTVTTAVALHPALTL
jgi:hypothetical protein